MATITEKEQRNLWWKNGGKYRGQFPGISDHSPGICELDGWAAFKFQYNNIGNRMRCRILELHGEEKTRRKDSNQIKQVAKEAGSDNRSVLRYGHCNVRASGIQRLEPGSGRTKYQGSEGSVL